MMSKATGIISEHGANITHMAVYRGENGKSTMVIGINSLNVDEIESAIEAAGFRVLYKLQNKNK